MLQSAVTMAAKWVDCFAEAKFAASYACNPSLCRSQARLLRGLFLKGVGKVQSTVSQRTASNCGRVGGPEKETEL